MGDVTTYTVQVPAGTSRRVWAAIVQAVQVWSSPCGVSVPDPGQPWHVRASVGLSEDVAEAIVSVVEVEGSRCPFVVVEAQTYEGLATVTRWHPGLGLYSGSVDERGEPVVSWRWLVSLPGEMTVADAVARVDPRAWLRAWEAWESGGGRVSV